MVEARLDHTATTLSDGKILMFGGTSNDYTPLGTAELFSPFLGAYQVFGASSVSSMYQAFSTGVFPSDHFSPYHPSPSAHGDVHPIDW
jgi:hypothetical protein